MNLNFEATKELSVIEINEKDIEKNLYKLIKRIVDIIGALIGCVILVPLTIFIWIANLISGDKGPVFFAQKRIGKDGKAFKLYKYRSMMINADKALKQYLINNPEKNEEFVKYRKLKDDPRITTVGRFIRTTTLDEMPQFINVLKGEMSLVGPRPYLFREKRAMKDKYDEIIKVKPGLTGPWQVSGRSETDFIERLKLDVEYSYKCSFLLDIKYFIKTFIMLLRKKGAL